MITLDIQNRDMKVSPEALREEGKMPAVFYGKKTASTPITIVQKDFLKVWKQAGESGVVSLKGAHGTTEVLIHEVQIDPRSDRPDHADFYVFEKGKKIEVSVPLEFIGVSPAVKDLGGNLVKSLRELKISADPQHIPHDITVDISTLATFDDVITAGDVKLPAGVVLVENPEEVLVSVVQPKEEVEETTPVDLSAIEVEKKGKKEEEEVPEA